MNNFFGFFSSKLSQSQEAVVDVDEEVDMSVLQIADGAYSVPASPDRPAKRPDLKKTPPRYIEPKEAEAANESLFDVCGPVEAVGKSKTTVVEDSAVVNEFPPALAENLRSLAVVENERLERMKGVDFPAGFPLGPFNTRDTLYEECRIWAADPNVCGGAFTLVKSTLRPGTSKRGANGNFLCSCSGKAKIGKSDTANPRPNTVSLKTDCPFKLAYEQSNEGWVVTGCSQPHVEIAKKAGVHCGSSIVHNHELATTRSAMNVNPGLRCLSRKLSDIAETLHKAGLGPARIYHCLVDQCSSEKIEVSFTQDDIKNKFQTSKDALALDCTNFMEHLIERRQQDADLGFAIAHDSEGRVNQIFLLLQNWRSLWIDTRGQVVLYDTKHGTNRYGMKLGCFSLIDGAGKTRVIAASFVMNESAEMFSWVFLQFNRLVGEAPVIIFTDSDLAMAQSIITSWPSTTHLLCIFHLWKNFFEHICVLFKGEVAKWREAASLFWDLAKTSDLSVQYTFDIRFDALVSAVNAVLSNVSDKKKMDTNNWLESLRSRKHAWAGCYTWQHCTYGIHSTQRAESMHRVIADFCRKTHTIGEIARHLETLAENKQLNKKWSCFDLLSLRQCVPDTQTHRS